MSELYLVMGKSASGKDSIFQMLQGDESLHLKTLIPYTTRPKREGEQEGQQYYFRSNAQFLEMKREQKIIEFRTYQTALGEWTYFTADDGQIDMNGNERYLFIGTLETYENIKKYYQKKRKTKTWLERHIKPIYIEVEDGERLQRALDREQKQNVPSYTELCRRFLADNIDFSEENLERSGIQRRFQNKVLTECLHEIRDYLLENHDQ